MSVTEYLILLMLIALADVLGFMILIIISEIRAELHFFKRDVRSWQENVCRITVIHDLDEDGR